VVALSRDKPILLEDQAKSVCSFPNPNFRKQGGAKPAFSEQVERITIL